MTDPETIKKDLAFCGKNSFCICCPYSGNGYNMMADALEYIEQLENELKEAQK